MNCRTVEERLDAWLDGELDPAQARSMKLHVRGCPVCSAKLAELGSLFNALGALPGPPKDRTLAGDTARAARERWAARPLRPWFENLNLFAKGLGVAALAAGLVLGAFLYTATFYQTAIASASIETPGFVVVASTEGDYL